MPTPTLFRRGDRGPGVEEIRARLAALGVLPEVSDTAEPVFDAAMDAAVRHFQQQCGITVDGTVGPITYRRLDEAHWTLGARLLHHQTSRPLRGEDVAELQQRLANMGFTPGRVDGIYGSLTERALRDFQRNVGIPVDGQCGPSTLKALERLTRTVVGGTPVALRENQALLRGGPSLSGKLVVVDPGHGGNDPGFVSPFVEGLTEADIAFDVASRIEGRLTALGVTAFLSHGRDIDGELDEEARADFANRARADLVVSVHADTSSSPDACGVATYYFGGGRSGAHSAVGERFADLVQEEIVARTDLQDSRTHAKTWELLRHTTMPAVRIELGYVSNAGDAQRLADPAFRDVLAEGIVVATQRLFTAPV